MGIHNAILAVNGGKKARKFMLDGPKAQRKPQLFAPTIKDFNVGRFMGVINGARK